MFIKEVVPKIILDSRKEKTIEISIKTYKGKFTASSPSGKSRGENEAEPFNKVGIIKSLSLMKLFSKKLKNKNFMIKKLDDLKILTEKIYRFEAGYGKLGRSVTYALETVFLKGAAADLNKELWQFINDDVNNSKKPKIPTPVGNCIGGGLHSKLIKGKRPDFQEFLLIPKEETFSRAVTKNLRAYWYSRRLVKTPKKNDEDAHMTSKTNEEVLNALKILAKKFKIRIGIDIAASTFFEKGYYKYKNKELIRDRSDQTDYVENLIKKYNLFYVEDPVHEEDFSGFKEILGAVKNKNTLIVGDDLTTSNIKFLRRAIHSGSINAIIIKPNQVNSILDVAKTVKLCKENKMKMIFSHRSGETMDNALADYAVGFGADYIKTGIFGRERLIKLKRVIDIEKSLK